MKTVPYSYLEEENTMFIENKSGSNGQRSTEIDGLQSQFSELINPNSRYRFMKVQTTLMEEEGIYKNDIVVIDPEEIPVNGKIVVVKLDDTFMIRRYEKMKNGFVLYADAHKVSSLVIEPGYENLELLGVVTFIIKAL